MEVMIFIIFFSLVFITTFALWKYVRLKHDVYEYTEKLDNTINYMLKNGELKTTPYENDDLWEKIYEKLVRLSLCLRTAQKWFPDYLQNTGWLYPAVLLASG